MRKSLWLAGLSSLLALGCSKDPRTAPLLPPCTATGSAVNLGVGQPAAISPVAIKGCYVFPAAPAGSAVQYLLVPQAASGTPNDSQPFKLQATALALAGIEAELVASEAAPAEVSPADQFHVFLRQSERRRSYPAQQPRPQRGPEAQLAAQAAPPPPRRPFDPVLDSGMVNSFKVCDSLDCKRLLTVDAALMKIGQHIALYVDTAAPKPGLSQADLDALRDVFDNRLYAVDRDAFGAESDIDGNGVVIVLMTTKVNELIAKPCTDGFVAGYFFGADIDPVFKTQYNNGEVFYSIVADPAPGKLNSCSHEVSQVKGIVPVTFVHEFQHMISYNQHVLVRPGDGEILWLNEALSHYAEERGGRSFLPADSMSFCQFVRGDLFNAAEYFKAPQSHFLVDASGIGGLANRGAYWLFLRYLIDQYAADTSLLAADAFTTTLVNTNATGATNVSQRASTPFATLVSRWSLANWVSDLPGFTAPTELKYKMWAFRSAYPLFNQGRPWQCTSALPSTFPLAPTVGPGSALSVSGVLRAGSGMYRLAQQGAGTAGFTLLFSDATGRALRTSLVPQLNVIRIQ